MAARRHLFASNQRLVKDARHLAVSLLFTIEPEFEALRIRGPPEFEALPQNKKNIKNAKNSFSQKYQKIDIAKINSKKMI